MPGRLFHEPVPRRRTVTRTGHPDGTAASAATGSDVDNLGTAHGAPWESATVTEGVTDVLDKLDAPASVRGAVVQWRHATDRAMLGVTAGPAAAANVWQTNGTSDNIVASHAGLSTTAEPTLAVVFRYRPEAAIALGTDNNIVQLTKAAGVGGTATDILIEIAADGTLQSRVWRVGPAPGMVTLTSTQRVDDGRWYGAAVTISGTTATLYVRTIDAGTAQLDSDTCAAHSSTSAMRLYGGQYNSVYLPATYAGAWYFSAALTAAQIDEIFENPASVYARDDLLADYYPAVAEAGTTTIADPVSAYDMTVPNSWTADAWPFAPLSYARPYHGPQDLRPVLATSGAGTSLAQTAATCTVVPTYSMIFGMRVPAAGSIDHDTVFLMWGEGTLSTHDLFLRWIAGKLRLNVLRISGSAQTGDSSTTYTADGTVRVVQVTVDDPATTAYLYVDGTLEATVTGISAYAASTTSRLTIGGTSADKARIEIMGPVLHVAGGLSAADGLAAWRSGVIPDARHTHYWPLDGDGTDYGSGAKDLTLTSTSWDYRVEVPGTHLRPLADRECRRGALVVDFGSEAEASEVYWRFDGGNSETGLIVEHARAFGGVELVAADALAYQVESSPRTVSFEARLTREELNLLRKLASGRARVALTQRQTDDALGEADESAYGELQELQVGFDYAQPQGSTTYWRGRLSVVEEV